MNDKKAAMTLALAQRSKLEQAAKQHHADAEAQLEEMIKLARELPPEDRLGWTEIANAIGKSRQATWKRWRHLG